MAWPERCSVAEIAVTPELLALLIASVAGAALAWLFDRDGAGSQLGGEAILLGIAASAGVLFVLSTVHVPWSRTALIAGLATVALCCGCRSASRRRLALIGRPAGPRYTAIPLELLTLLLLVGYASFATLAPVWEFDFLADWGLKARTFWEAGGIDWAFLEHPLHRNVHPDYPPLLPLAFDALAVMRGAWNDRTAGLLSVAFAVGILLVIHRLALEESESPLAAAFVTAALVPFAATPWVSLAEGPMVAYGTAGLLLVRKGIQRELPRTVATGAVMLGLAALSKNEGTTLIVAAALALLAERRPRDIVRLWPALAVVFPWLVLRSLHALPTDLATPGVASRIVEHLRQPQTLLAAIAHYSLGKGLFWLGMAAGVVMAIRTLLARERFVLVALLTQLGFYIAAYLASPHDIGWHVRWSWERLAAHLTPALTYVVLMSLIVPRGASEPAVQS
jgi:hypothetical protein